LSNNLIVGTKNGINYSYWSSYCLPGSTYKNLKIVHNVIINPAEYALSMLATSGVPGTAVAANNIFDKGGLDYYTIGNPSVWSFSHNTWLDGLPSSLTHPNSLNCQNSPPTVCPGFVGGLATAPESYQLLPASVNRQQGTVTTVTTDFWGNSRSNPPSIGLHEPVPLPPGENDRDSDGDVDFADLNRLLSLWSTGTSVFDFNRLISLL
jgi:hypothetical protein